MFFSQLRLRKYFFVQQLAAAAGALVFAFNVIAADPPAKPMKMDEPMAGQMKKDGMKKGDVKKAAEKKDKMMKPMLEKESKAMSKGGAVK